MKKTLLILSVLFITVLSISAQGVSKVWNFGGDATKFPLSAGIGAGPDKSVYVDGLGIHTGSLTGTNMGAITASSKTFGSFTFVNRFQFNGGGYHALQLLMLLLSKYAYSTLFNHSSWWKQYDLFYWYHGFEQYRQKGFCYRWNCLSWNYEFWWRSVNGAHY